MANVGNLSAIKRDVQRQKARDRPVEPNSLATINIQLPWTSTGGQHPVPFLFHDSGPQDPTKDATFRNWRVSAAPRYVKWMVEWRSGIIVLLLSYKWKGHNNWFKVKAPHTGVFTCQPFTRHIFHFSFLSYHLIKPYKVQEHSERCTYLVGDCEGELNRTG